MTNDEEKALRDAGMTDEEIAEIKRTMPVGGVFVPQTGEEQAAARARFGAKITPHTGPMPEKFKTTLLFDEVELAPGETKTVDGKVEDRVALFRGEKIIASESAPGTTRVLMLTVATPSKGERPQMPTLEGGRPTVAYREFGGEVLLDTHDPTKGPVRFSVRNVSDQPVKWSAKIEGKAIGR